MVVDATNQIPYVVCTTCHNQHQMNVYLSSTASPIAGVTTGTYATYFFVNAPYNRALPGLRIKLLRQRSSAGSCHFGEANEAFGLDTVTTAF